MKRQIFLIILIILFICMLLGMTVYLVKPEVFRKKGTNETDNKPEIVTYTYNVYEGNIIQTYDAYGSVVSGEPDEYIETYFCDNISEKNFSLKKGKGDECNANDVIFTYNGNEKIINYDGKIVDIQYFEKGVSISVLNYNKLYIMSSIEESRYDEIDYETKVKVIYRDKEYDTYIQNIGYEIVSGEISVRISVPIRMLPGTAVKIQYVMKENHIGLYVNEEAIFSDGENYYTFIQTKNGKEQVNVTVGKRFSVEEDGNVFNYLEILSGLTTEDCIIVEKMAISENAFGDIFDNE